MPVLVAGAGATLYEYYRVPQPLGSAVMTGLLLAAYLMGFERLIQVISSIGPVIIVFSLAIGCGAIAVDYGQFSRIGEYESALAPYQAAPNWFLSAVLHLSLNFFPPSMYFTRLGVSASSKQELRAGAFLGAFVVILCIAVMTTAILLNGSAAAGLDIPVLYLAQKLHPLSGRGLFHHAAPGHLFLVIRHDVVHLQPRHLLGKTRQRRLCRCRRPVYLRCQPLFLWPLSRCPLSGHRLRWASLYRLRSIQKFQNIRYAKQRMSILFLSDIRCFLRHK